MSESEAKSKALAAGVTESQLTPEILKLYGYEAPAPTAGVPVGAVILPETVKSDLQALEAEAKANALPAQIAASLGRVLSWAKTVGFLAVLLIALMFSTSGCSSTQASRAVEQSTIAVQALNDQHLALEEADTAYYRQQETTRVNELHAAAMKSATRVQVVAVQKPITVRTVKPDGTAVETQELQTVSEPREFIETNVADALSRQRIAALQQIEQRILDRRTQQAAICANYATFQAYADGLQAYFSQKTSTYEALKQSQETLLEFLKTFVVEKDGK